MQRILFLCSQNRLRSPTAEHVFSQYPELECDSAGLHESADVYLSPEQLHWAETIFVMERAHRNKLTKKFKQHLHGKRIIVLGIPDNYEYLEPVLITLLQTKVTPHLRITPKPFNAAV